MKKLFLLIVTCLIVITSNAQYSSVKVSLSSTDILGLGTPYTLISAPGSGKVIVPIKIFFKWNFVTLAYTGNTNMQIYENSTFNPVFPLIGSILNFGSGSMMTMMDPANMNGGTILHQLWDNQALMLRTIGGNPSTGDGTLDVYIIYDVITL